MTDYSQKFFSKWALELSCHIPFRNAFSVLQCIFKELITYKLFEDAMGKTRKEIGCGNSSFSHNILYLMPFGINLASLNNILQTFVH